MRECVIVAARRSPAGKIPGQLNYITETQLLAKVMRATAGTAKVEEAVVGCSFPIERDNLCRKAMLAAGFSACVNASTVSKTCASSDEALRIGYERILLGECRCILVGGIEKISNSPYILQVMKRNVKRQLRGQTLCRVEAFAQLEENDMAYLAELAADRQGITRREQDDFTIESIRRAQSARREGRFTDELTEVAYEKDGVCYRLSQDELLDSERTAEQIRGAPAMFLCDGTLTQYNAAPVCDCASAVLLMEREFAVQCGLQPLVAIRSVVTHATSHLGCCMQECVEKLLQINRLHRKDVSIYEINESFAAQAISTIHALRLEDERVNVNGGNLALGYPIGTTGLRMLVTLIHTLRRSGDHLGLSVMCAGGAMAQAVLVEGMEP